VFSNQEKTMRHSLGKLVGLAAAFGLAVGTFGSSSIASARASKDGSADKEVAQIDPAAYEQVDSITMLTRPYSWQRIDDDTMIVWSTPFQPYLVELSFPSHDMRWVEHIGLTQTGAKVYAKFDSVQIRGFRYPIRAIYKMSREEARNLERST
jgi:hypothetical protein